MATKESSTTDVVIVGAGMVGATLALALSSSDNIQVTLVDGGQPVAHLPNLQSATSDPTVDDFDIRVSAITNASKRLFSSLGVWQDIEKCRLSPYRKMYVWDSDGTGNISFDAADLHLNELGHIVENSAILASLHQALQARPNVVCRFGSAVTALELKPVTSLVTLNDGHSLACQLVVAADGANSRLRSWANMPTREWDYQQHAIIGTVETEKPHDGVARQRFMDAGPLAFLPLPSALSSRHFCSIVWSAEPGLANSLMQMDDAGFCAALGAAFEEKLGVIRAVSKRVSIPLRQRHAKHYVKPGFTLVGDAAHTIHPLAGQGVNLGLGDAMVLAEELIRSVKASVSLGDLRVLQRFERRRQGDNLAMMGMMEGFKRLFSDDDIVVRWFRNAGLNLFDRAPLLKKEIISQAMGRRVRVPDFGGHYLD